MRSCLAAPIFLLVFSTCSSGGYEPSDGAVPPADLAADLQAPADASSVACVTTFSCDARTAEHGCGVTTATGQRYPDQGTPYCTGDKTTRQGCSCDLVRCTSPAPLCAGSYQAVFNERIISGCSGIANTQSGTCFALWNTVQTSPAVGVLADRVMYNVYLDWAFADYQQAFNLTTPSVVTLTVQQSCWLSDVAGSGNAGRSEVSKITVLAQ